MVFSLFLTDEAEETLRELGRNSGLAKRLKAVRKTLALLESNPRHPGLQTHKFQSLSGPNGEELFEAYAEQRTPAAYRVFWFYGPEERQITIVAITRHPWQPVEKGCGMALRAPRAAATRRADGLLLGVP